jgi:hypothetical protein
MRSWLMLLVTGCGSVAGSDEGSDAQVPPPKDADVDADADADEPGGLGPWAVPTRIDALSTASFADSYPTLSADGLEMFFQSNRTSNNDVYRSTRPSTTAAWGAPVRVPELSAAGNSESGPELSSDGRRIWFSRLTVSASWEIFTATRSAPGATWSTPVVVAEVNSAGADSAPQVTADGLTMFFSREVAGLDREIMTATRATTTAPWSSAQAIPRFSSTADDDNPTVTGDGGELYFDRANVIYRATATATGWSAPVAVARLTGGHRAEVSNDGRYMVLSIANAQGNSDLYETSR